MQLIVYIFGETVLTGPVLMISDETNPFQLICLHKTGSWDAIHLYT